MSIAVDVDRLADVLHRYGFAYLVTVGDDGRPHLVAVSPVLAGGALSIGDLGRTTARNLAARPDVTLVWPPAVAGDHSLIVDGSGALHDAVLRVTPTRAVLHRPARPAAAATVPDDGCAADCVEL